MDRMPLSGDQITNLSSTNNFWIQSYNGSFCYLPFRFRSRSTQFHWRRQDCKHAPFECATRTVYVDPWSIYHCLPLGSNLCTVTDTLILAYFGYHDTRTRCLIWFVVRCRWNLHDARYFHLSIKSMLPPSNKLSPKTGNIGKSFKSSVIFM